MPRKYTKPAGTNLLPDEMQKTKELAQREGGIAQYIRRLIIEDCQKRGEEWPTK